MLQSQSTDIMSIAYDFHQLMREHKLILAYEGVVNQDLTKAFTSLTENNLSDEDSSVSKKVFHIMVECLQNLAKHTLKEEPIDYKSSIFLVSKGDKFFSVTTGNSIAIEARDDLEKKLTHLNSLEKDEIKKLYIQTLKSGDLSEKSGAGLGLIDMVKKTGQKLEFSFVEINDKFSFFLFKVNIPRA
ncbi:MAG: SiaB family protein kinase [Luteibaculaceae bacterium]